jgi:hypothetical protein
MREMKMGLTIRGHLLLAAVLLLATGWLAAADDETRVETVHFAKGASSKTITGTIKGWQAVEYHLGARAGQTMAVTLKSSNSANYFNVTAPGTETALFTGADRGNHYSGSLPKDGTYKVLVFLMRNEARRGESADYSISFSITE